MRLPAVLATGLIALVVGVAAPARAADSPDFRLFLRDGRFISTFGEFARVGDRVVFSLAVPGVASAPLLQLVSLPAPIVDWEKTDAYADAVRASRYANSRGDADFAALSSDVAAALNEIGMTADANRRLALAEATRRKLLEWPREHFAYRAADVRELTSMVDELIGELRANSGMSSFDLSLVATLEPPSTPLLPPPTPKEAIEQALLFASVSDVPDERLVVWQLVDRALDGSDAALPAAWAGRTRGDVRGLIEAETSIEREYSKLAREAMPRAMSRARRGDVGGVERVLEDVRNRDDRMGHRRPQRVAALVGAIRERLDIARRLRLAIDGWKVRQAAYEKYKRGVHRVVDVLQDARSRLEQIRRLSGPDATSLPRLSSALERARRVLVGIMPPEDCAGVHATLASALQLGSEAVRIRHDAVVRQDLQAAWNASAAAAGALMLSERATTELANLLISPELR